MDLRNIPPAAKGAAAATAVWLTIAITVVAGFEGFSGKPYRDSVGVETICYGATGDDGVDFSKVYTKAECEKMLGTDLLKYDAMLQSCVKVPLPPHREAAFVSAIYNFGRGAFCRSAIVRNINAGRVKAACDALLQYNHAGGRVLSGLTRRRQVERALCLRND
jgi:lysozyme